LSAWPALPMTLVLPVCGRDGMVDIPDLKSEGRMPVGVRVPPPAPPGRKIVQLSQSK
jgi:hypothetical protein